MVLGIKALHLEARSLSCVELLVAELSAGRDVELSEDVVEVPFDRSGADVQLLGDFGVRVAVSGQRGDLRFLRWSPVFGLWLRARTGSPVALNSRRARLAKPSARICTNES